jgi:membrane-associated protease RseP (regulator of RpoE activity)
VTILLYGLGTLLVFELGVAIYQFAQAIAGAAGGIQVEAVSVGFGPVLFSRKIGGWEIRISAFPWGGYTRFKGTPDPEDPVQDDTGRFHRASIITRIVTVLIGPITNLVLAFVFLGIPVWAGADQMETAVRAESEVNPCAVPGLAFRHQPSTWELQLRLAEETAGQFTRRVITLDSLEGWGSTVGFLVTSGAIANVSVWGWFTAQGVLFLALGLFNLLPVPCLNGFQFACLVFEGVTSIKVSEKIVLGMTYVGLLALLAFMLRLLWIDGAWLLQLLRG